MSIETLVGTFTCPQEGCGRSFPTAQSLQGHFNYHSRKTPRRIPCPHCGNKYYSGTGMSQHIKARHKIPAVSAELSTPTPAPAPSKRGRPAKNRIDLDWTTDDIFSTVIEALWPGGSLPVHAVLPLIQWRETTREFLEKVQSE
jgi:hypothetical protein